MMLLRSRILWSTLLPIFFLSFTNLLYASPTSGYGAENAPSLQPRFAESQDNIQEMGMVSTRDNAPISNSVATSNLETRTQRRNLLDSSANPSRYLLQRHKHISNHLSRHTTHDKRGFVTYLAVLGFTLLWENIDIVIASDIARLQQHELWANISAFANARRPSGPSVENGMTITWGLIKITMVIVERPMAQAIGQIGTELGIAADFIEQFAMVMLQVIPVVVVGVFTVLAWSADLVIQVTQRIVGDRGPGMITG